jgi:ribonuclease-3
VTFEKLEARLGYRFSDQTLLTQALTHKSLGAKNNERLEFLGDAALGFLVGCRLFREFPNANEHGLTLMRASLVKGEALAEVAQMINLGDYLQLGVGERKSGGHRRESLLADALEAIVGAVFLDGGMPAADDVVGRLFAEAIAKAEVQAVKDAKTELQETMQARGIELPEYRLEEQTGKAHAPGFRVSCSVAALALWGEGGGSSRREAEQAAAGAVLAILRDVDDGLT